MVRLLNVSLYPVVTVLKLNAVLLGFFFTSFKMCFCIEIMVFLLVCGVQGE